MHGSAVAALRSVLTDFASAAYRATWIRPPSWFLRAALPLAASASILAAFLAPASPSMPRRTGEGPAASPAGSIAEPVSRPAAKDEIAALITANSKVASGGEAPPKVRKRDAVVTIEAGDTLFGLSRRYGVAVARIIAVNRLSGPKIEAGQRLVIPVR